jgi:hypothetical protein
MPWNTTHGGCRSTAARESSVPAAIRLHRAWPDRLTWIDYACAVVLILAANTPSLALLSSDTHELLMPSLDQAPSLILYQLSARRSNLHVRLNRPVAC